MTQLTETSSWLLVYRQCEATGLLGYQRALFTLPTSILTASHNTVAPTSHACLDHKNMLSVASTCDHLSLSWWTTSRRVFSKKYLSGERYEAIPPTNSVQVSNADTSSLQSIMFDVSSNLRNDLISLSCQPVFVGRGKMTALEYRTAVMRQHSYTASRHA